MTLSLRYQAACWAFLILLHGLLAVWVLLHPVGLPSDDALFFARGIVRFSVLEFSPHFPGYPGFILLGRLAHLFTGDAEKALFLVSVSCMLLLPYAAAWAVEERYRLSAYALALTQPLLPGLGLALLSDSSGLLFFLLCLGLVRRERWSWAGAVLGFAACCRPSYAPMMTGLVFGVLAAPHGLRQGGRLVLGGLAVSSPIFGAVLTWEGESYIAEGLRFVEGHSTVWGNTVLSAAAHDSWSEALSVLPGGLFIALTVLAAALLTPRDGFGRLLLLSWGAALLWTLLMQNPENLRHMAPVLMLGGLLAARCEGSRRWLIPLLLIAQVWTWVQAVDPRLSLPPLMQAEQALASLPPGIVLTNHGVALLRDRLTGQRVYDLHYAAHAGSAAQGAETSVFRLTSSPVEDGELLQVFPARFPGEQPLWLRQLR